LDTLENQDREMKTITLFAANCERLSAVLLLVALLTSCSGFSLLPQAPVTVRFVYLEGNIDYQAIATEFQRQHTNITITLAPLSYDENVFTNFQSSLADADVIRVPSDWLVDDVIKQIQPLDSLLSTDSAFPRSWLFPGSLEALQLDGKQIAIPAGLEPLVVYYNPQKFADAGVQPPNPDWTLEDFVRAAQAVNNQSDYQRFAYGYCGGYVTGLDALTSIYLFGGSLADDDTSPTRPYLNRPENADGLAWLASLKDLGILPEVTSAFQLAQTIGSQHCGFWLDTVTGRYFGAALAYGAGSAPVKLAMLPLPKHLGSYPVVNLEAYAIPAKSDNTQAAWQWLTFLMQQPSAAGSLIPPYKTQVFARGNPYQISAQLLAVAERLPEKMVLMSLNLTRNPALNTLYSAFMTAQEKVFKGEASAPAALEAAQREAETGIK
jgi:ABC-type glycerol-3-phosphate transport system substrate-binding protein